MYFLNEVNLFVLTNQYVSSDPRINSGGGLAQVVTNVSEKLPPDKYRVFVLTLASQDVVKYKPKPNVTVIGLKPHKNHGEKRGVYYGICPTREGWNALDLGFTAMSYMEENYSKEMEGGKIWGNDWFTACAMMRLYEEHRMLGVYSWHMSKNRPDYNDPRLNWEREIADHIKNNGSWGHAVSETQKKIVRAAYDLPREKVTVIRNGVDVKIFRPYQPDSYLPVLEKHGIKKPFIHWSGRTAIEKRADQVIKSFPYVLDEYPDEHLVLLGLKDESGIESLYRECNSLTPKVKDRVRIILDNISDEERAKIYAASDVGVFPSDPKIAPEAFGMVSTESQSCGVPVVVNKDTGLIETTIPGLTGLPVDGSCLKELADAIVECISKKEEWGKNARKLMEDFFSWDNIVPEYDRLFSKLN